MTDVKRNYSDIVSLPVDNADLDSGNDLKKLHTKPGRKQIETEPKSKRTAQNRAAQRAYRERKERKMQELEEKVKMLEDENVRATTETDFLQAQVNILKNELAKYRGTTDFLDLNLPTTVGHLSHPHTNKEYSAAAAAAASQQQQQQAKDQNVGSGRANSASSRSSGLDRASSNSSISTLSPNFSFGLPWSKENLKYLKQQQEKLLQLHQTHQKQQKQPRADATKPASDSSYNTCPDLVSGSSTSTTPLDDNILVSPDSNSSSINSNRPNINFAEKFEEEIDPFCSKLNEACGTRANPIPKQQQQQQQQQYQKQQQQQHLHPSTSSIPGQSVNSTMHSQYNSPLSYLLPSSTTNSAHNVNTPHNTTSIAPDQSKNNYMNDAFFNNLSGLDDPEFNFNILDNKYSTDDPLSFLNDMNGTPHTSNDGKYNNSNVNNNNNNIPSFDAALAFDDSFKPHQTATSEREIDPMSFLTTEESMYDFTNKVGGQNDINTNFNFNDFIKDSIPERKDSTPRTGPGVESYNGNSVGNSNINNDDDEDDEENDIVPAPQQTMKCSEIWDRITSHPRYTELDIDGLCSELKSKAKCSEKGVVINTTDVNELLGKSAK
ncbi:hypothetical protein PP707_06680 [Acetobacter pasteurianus]|nr:hypothetical protein [Acetobacter pasteurianus]